MQLTSLAPGGSANVDIPIHVASVPVGAVVSGMDLYLYLYLPDGGRLRVSCGPVSAEVNGTGVARLVFGASDVPPAVVSGLGQVVYVPVTFTFLNTGDRPLRFAMGHYLPLLGYSASSTPAPVYHGIVPYGTPGNYVDRYVIPGNSMWSTRVVYRGVRSAFPFLICQQVTAQAVGSVAVQSMHDAVPVRSATVGLKELYQTLLRWLRLSGIDGFYPGDWMVVV